MTAVGPPAGGLLPRGPGESQPLAMVGRRSRRECRLRRVGALPRTSDRSVLFARLGLRRSEDWIKRHRHVPGDLLEIDGWWFIEDGDVCADFLVTWRHPEEGLGGAYRGGGGGYDPSGGFGPEQLASVVEHTVLGEAKIDFAHHSAYFARDLRIAPVRDTTDTATYNVLRAGRPYPRRCGRILFPDRAS